MTAPTVASRKSVEARGGGRGGAGNIEAGVEHEYVDGGLYRTESPGANGKAYSTGRGGFGNIGEGHTSDIVSQDNYAPESVRSQKGEIGSGGRGGAGNIGEIESQDTVVPTHAAGAGAMHQKDVEGDPVGYEKNPHLEKRRLSKGVSHLGMADKLKYGLLNMVKKS